MIFPFFILIGLPVVLLVGAVILRTAITFANGRIGPVPDEIAPSRDDDDWADYPVPGERESPRTAIPMPTIGGGMMMVLAIVLVNVFVGAAIQLVIGDEPVPRRRRFRGPLDDVGLIARLVTVPASFLITSGLLAAMLPTTFRRGCLVAFFSFLISLGIAAIFYLPILALD